MKKLVISTILALCLALCMGTFCVSAAEVASGTCGENLTWTLDDAGKLTINGTGKMDEWNNIFSVPWYSHVKNIKELSLSNDITRISSFAFSGTNIKNVTIPDATETIGGSAFQSTKLKSIHIPANVKVINYGVFTNCYDLESITVSPENTHYASNEEGILFSKDNTVIVAYPCALNKTTYTIPDGVKEIFGWCFAGNKSIETVILPSSITTLNQNCLGAQFKKIIVDNDNIYFSSDEHGVLFDKNKTSLLCYPRGNEATSYNVPDGVKTISDESVSYSQNLTRVTLSDTVESIGRFAFNFCKNLEIYIGPGVTMINANSFSNCAKLKIFGYSDSYAETYAGENNIPFICVDKIDGNIDLSPETNIEDIIYLASSIVNGKTPQLSDTQKKLANLYEDYDGNGEPIINIKDIIALAKLIASQNA